MLKIGFWQIKTTFAPRYFWKMPPQNLIFKDWNWIGHAWYGTAILDTPKMDGITTPSRAQNGKKSASQNHSNTN